MIKGYLKDKYRETISVLADNAVKMVENMAADGSIKKEVAVNFILKMLPVNPLLKLAIGQLLNELADEAVEFALRRFKCKVCTDI